MEFVAVFPQCSRKSVSSCFQFYRSPPDSLIRSSDVCLSLQRYTHTHTSSCANIFGFAISSFQISSHTQPDQQSAACLNRSEKRSLISRIHANHFISQFSTFPNCLLYCLVSSRCEPPGLLSHLRFDPFYSMWTINALAGWLLFNELNTICWVPCFQRRIAQPTTVTNRMKNGNGMYQLHVFEQQTSWNGQSCYF